MILDYTRDAIEKGEGRGVEWVTGPVADFKAVDRWTESRASDDDEYKVEVLPEVSPRTIPCKLFSIQASC